jgi:predicted nucleotide-binding protein (sugar kinase/HSP70/actin superfamily)
MNNTSKIFNQAKFSFRKNSIIDSNGNTISFNDKRIVHIWPIHLGQYLKLLLAKCYKKYNLNFRACGETNSEILKYARKISSGRECLPFNSIAGSIYKDVLSRNNDEISLYYTIDPFGPCQNSGWPIILDIFLEREQIKNAIFSVTMTKSTNYFGNGINIIKDFARAICLSDILEEAESSIKCLAKNREDAIKQFNEATNELIFTFNDNKKNQNKAIRKWNTAIYNIPKKTTLKKTPKILIFGGLNILFTNHQIKDYFNDSEIIVKCVDLLEGILFSRSFYAVEYAAKNDLHTPEKLFTLSTAITLFLQYFIHKKIRKLGKSTHSSKNKFKTALSISEILYLEFINKQYRKKMNKSGILYDKYIPFKRLTSKGNKYITNNAFTETCATIGRYINSAENNTFDGLINIGTFNCQPAMNSMAILRSISNYYNIPFISMDCDGGELSSNQIRLLESIAVQANRYKKNKK